MYYVCTPSPPSWRTSSLYGKWEWQTNWNHWRLHISVETFHEVPLNGKVKVTNTIVLIYLDHNCSQMSNWVSLMHQNKSESEKTGKGVGFNILFRWGYCHDWDSCDFCGTENCTLHHLCYICTSLIGIWFGMSIWRSLAHQCCCADVPFLLP